MSSVICMFCGGAKCKYENYLNWISQKDSHNAIEGLYSNWVTDHIIATARPSSKLLQQHNIVNQFQKNGVKAIINLQLPGEHSECGNGIQKSGFAYLPEEFMEHGIFYYNFGWEDMTVPTVELIMSIVQVMDFTISQDHKMAVHCHAGLGRTGLAIASYLVYKGMNFQEAVAHVRLHRPGSIQTKKQEEFVGSFEKYLHELRVTYAEPEKHSPFSFIKYLNRQRRLLHGNEMKELRMVPKVVHLSCQKLNQLHSVRGPQELDKVITMDVPFKVEEKLVPFNQDKWDLLLAEEDVNVVMWIMLQWFYHLKHPLLGKAAEVPESIEFVSKLYPEQRKTLLLIIQTVDNIDLGHKTEEWQCSEPSCIFVKIAECLIGRNSVHAKQVASLLFICAKKKEWLHKEDIYASR